MAVWDEFVCAILFWNDDLPAAVPQLTYCSCFNWSV